MNRFFIAIDGSQATPVWKSTYREACGQLLATKRKDSKRSIYLMQRSDNGRWFARRKHIPGWLGWIKANAYFLIAVTVLSLPWFIITCTSGAW